MNRLTRLLNRLMSALRNPRNIPMDDYKGATVLLEPRPGRKRLRYSAGYYVVYAHAGGWICAARLYASCYGDICVPDIDLSRVRVVSVERSSEKLRETAQSLFEAINDESVWSHKTGDARAEAIGVHRRLKQALLEEYGTWTETEETE